MKRLKKIFILFFSGLTISLATHTAFADAQSLNSVAAIVNDSIITQVEFNAALTQAQRQMAGDHNPNPIDPAKLRTLVLRELIDEKLQLELAKKANITATNADVSAAIKRIATGNHLTVAQLQQALQQRGMNFADYKKMIHKQLIIRNVEESAVGNKVHVDAAAIAAARLALQSQVSRQQQYHVIDMVFAEKADAEKTEMQLKNGAKISAVAPSANDLGWQTPNTLPSIFLAQLSKMQPGDIAGPIQAPNGFHVIKLVDMRGQPLTKPTTAQLQNIAYQMQFQKAAGKWLAELRKTAYVKIVAQ